MIKTEGSRALSQRNREYPSLTCYKGPNFKVLFLFGCLTQVSMEEEHQTQGKSIFIHFMDLINLF